MTGRPDGGARRPSQQPHGALGLVGERVGGAEVGDPPLAAAHNDDLGAGLGDVVADEQAFGRPPRRTRAWAMTLRSVTTMTSPRTLTMIMIRAITCRL